MASTQSKPINSHTDADPFDSLLTLEDDLYTTAYSLGVAAGSRSGRIEGRLFGLEQGFEKFSTLGELHGRSVVWGARIPTNTSAAKQTSETAVAKEEKGSEEQEGEILPDLKTKMTGGSRLTSSIHLLHGLTDPATFSTENTEEAVADYDDRVRRAGAKSKVIERIVGESLTTTKMTSSPDNAAGAGVRVKGDKEKKTKGKGDENMEDFAGSRLIR